MNFCIIGKGSIGKRHCRILHKLNQKVFFLRRRKKFLNEIDYQSNDILKKIDFFIICNPTSLHKEALDKISIFNKPILIEKPMFDEKVNYKTIKKKILKRIYVAYMMRFDPRINYLKKKINLNKVKISKFIWTTNMPKWHKNENFKKSYASQKKLGGGVLLTCSHEIDMSIFLFGEVKNCKIIYIKKDLKINVDEKCLVILQHKNNIVSEIYLDFTNQNNSRKLDIVTTDRIFKWDFNKNYIQVIKKNKIENIKIKFNLDNIYEKQISKEKFGS